MDAAIDHVDGAVGERGKALVVGDDDERLTKLIAKAEEEFVKLFLVVRIKATRWLIGEYHVGIVHQGTSHGYALFLTARELGRLVGGAVGQTHEVEQLKCTLLDLSIGTACYHARYHHVLRCCKLWQELVKLEYEAEVLAAKACKLLGGEAEHVFACNRERTFVGPLERAHDLQQGGLSRSAGTYDAHYFVGLNVEVDALEHFELAEGFVYIL